MLDIPNYSKIKKTKQNSITHNIITYPSINLDFKFMDGYGVPICEWPANLVKGYENKHIFKHKHFTLLKNFKEIIH